MSDIATTFSRIPRDRVLVTAPVPKQCWTAADLDATATMIADALVRDGLRPGHLVVSILGNRPMALATFLACRYAGAALLPLDRATSTVEAHATIERLGARIVLLPTDSAAPECCKGARSIAPDLCMFSVSTNAECYRNAAVLKVTSGSTGLPKATITTEGQLFGDSESIIEAMGIRPDDVQLAVIPLSHAYAIGNLVVPLFIQGTSMVVREGFIPDRIIDDAETFGVRVWPGVPFMFQHLLENPPPRWPRTLTHLISAGAPLGPATARDIYDAFGVTIHAFYGTSESGGIAYDERPAPYPPPPDGIGVGLPLPGVTVTLRDAEVPATVGRIHVTTRGVSNGYAGLDDPSFVDSGFLTGDLGRFDHDGRVVLTGRVSSFVNVAGRKVQPDEVVSVLRSCPGVEDVHVFGIGDPKRGETLAACVISTAEEVSPASIRRYCATLLAAHKIPRVVLKLSRWPVSDRGKVERSALIAQAEAELSRRNSRAML